jgi:cell wall-associated NlpC family hydrolase
VKKYLYIFGLLFLLTSCASTRTVSYPGSSSVPPPEKVERDPQYLENISIKPGKDEAKVHKPAAIESPKTVAPVGGFSSDIEKSNYLQFKYAILLEETVESMTNARLISFLENWYGTPYQFGGDNKTGIDCSAFTCLLMDSVYNITLPRTAKNQYNSSQKIRREDLTQGDLVFFNTTGGISHVGVYLANNKFVHAAASSGVMISDLDEAYFKKRYIGAARVK